jgi:hypothetical protein
MLLRPPAPLWPKAGRAHNSGWALLSCLERQIEQALNFVMTGGSYVLVGSLSRRSR